MKSRRLLPLLPTGGLLALLVGSVIVPAVLSISVGIVALALHRQALDIVIGVLVLSFAAMGVIGGSVAIGFLRRSARLSEMQADFVANVSHELRTPLAGMRLLVETLAKGRADSPAAREAVLEHLASEEQRLEALVDRILTWRRAASGAGGPRTLESVTTLVERAVPPAVADGARIRVELPEDARSQPLVLVDRDAFIGALQNLLDNALKFSGPEAPVTVSARLAGNLWLIAVSDHGPGIAPRERKRILEPFYRAVAHRHHRGTGLGLAIVRRVMEDHGGEVLVESTPDEGSTFTLALPIADAEPRDG